VQEMMSCNLPLFVWDKTVWDDYGQNHTIDASSVPYWDDRCGVLIKNNNNIIQMFEEFIKNVNKFNPRQYVISNLTLEKTTKKIINLTCL
jgi:hypothetical protein